MPVRKVFLIGTNHRYQMVTAFTPVTTSQFEEFRAMLRDLISQNQIHGIAEEMNIEWLRNWRCSDHSIPFRLAGEIGIAHRYCDPDEATREALSIPKGEEGFPKRERYWLEQLQTFDRFPALFIMGANHFENFRDLLTQAGFEAVEVVRDWTPSDFMGDDELERRFLEG